MTPKAAPKKKTGIHTVSSIFKPTSKSRVAKPIARKVTGVHTTKQLQRDAAGKYDSDMTRRTKNREDDDDDKDGNYLPDGDDEDILPDEAVISNGLKELVADKLWTKDCQRYKLGDLLIIEHVKEDAQKWKSVSEEALDKEVSLEQGGQFELMPDPRGSITASDIDGEYINLITQEVFRMCKLGERRRKDYRGRMIVQEILT